MTREELITTQQNHTIELLKQSFAQAVLAADASDYDDDEWIALANNVAELIRKAKFLT